MVVVGDGIADGDVVDGFDVGDDKADLAGGEGIDGGGAGGEFAEVGDVEEGVLAHHADALGFDEGAVDDADVDDDAAVVVVLGVEDEGLEGGVGGAFGGREAGDDGFEEFVDAEAGFGGDVDAVEGVDAEDLFHFLSDGFGLGGGEIDLVDDGDDGEVGVDGGESVGDGLGLDALRGVAEEQGAFAGLEGLGDLVMEIDVAGGVDEVEHVFGAAEGVLDGYGGGLDGDAAFAFEVHIVEELGFHFALGDGAGAFEEAVGEGGLAVVDVGDDAEVADVGVGHE